ncbi:unnamed protein product [Sphagnum balticum]
MKTLSRIDLPSTKPVWLGLMMCGRAAWSLSASTLAKILYTFPRSVIGLQLLSLARSPYFGMRVITHLLMNVEVAPSLSIAMNASSRSDAISFSHSWKNSMGMPSWPGALPFGKARMAPHTSSIERRLVKLAFMASMTLIGTLCQHWSCASVVPGARASEV